MSKPIVKRRYFEYLCILIFLAIVLSQTFGQHSFGLANNGDFPKVLGRLGIWPAATAPKGEFAYFITDYRIERNHVWNSRLPTTEMIPARAAEWLAQLLLPRGHFDLRILGLLHLSILTLAVWLILCSLRQMNWTPTILIGALTILIFADIEYTEFLNTAYMDASAIYGLILLIALALNLPPGEPGIRQIFFFGAAGCLFLGSKPQQLPCLVPVLVFCSFFLVRAASARAKFAWSLSICLLCGVSLWGTLAMPRLYQADSLFDVVFLNLTVLTNSPQQTLRELGRPSNDMRYVGMHAYVPDTPLKSRAYREQFRNDVTTLKLLAFYFRHPSITAQILWGDLLKAGRDIPPVSEVPVGISQKTFTVYGTYRKQDNPEPFQRPRGLDAWSNFRRFLCSRFPLLTPSILVAIFVHSLVKLFGRQSQSAIYQQLNFFLITSIGILAFLTGALADATDTSRHIVLYQVSFDLLLIALARSGATKWCNASGDLSNS